MFFEFGGDV